MSRKKRFFVAWSKLLTAAVTLLACGFVIWACLEMHRLSDLSPVAYIGTSVIGLLAAVVSAYMWRARQRDQFELELKKSREMARLRTRYGSAVRDEHVECPDAEDDGTMG